MRSVSGIASRWLLTFLVAAASCIHTVPAWTQTPQYTGHVDPERARAFELYESGKILEAIPMLEKLATDHPTDAVIFERWACSIATYAETLADPEARKQTRVHALQIARKAKALGDNSLMLRHVLDLPEDGSEPVLSTSKEVDVAMRTAAAAFIRGDLENARAGYLRVLLLDPNNYEAMVSVGETYFRQRVLGSAGEWFARAVQMEPNRETAYRYWADALAQSGRNDAARSKFIEAVVADPYDQLTWSELQKWARTNNVELNYVKLKDPSTVSASNLDNPNVIPWMTYAVGRAGWQTEKSKKEFPNLPRGRHTLQEETHALDLMITILKKQSHDRKMWNALDTSLQSLVKIQEAGFLEPFVLLNRADAEIAQDYDAYRASKRDQIRRYLDEFVVPKTPAIKN